MAIRHLDYRFAETPLERYGQHDSGCPLHGTGNPRYPSRCRCGFLASITDERNKRRRREALFSRGTAHFQPVTGHGDGESAENKAFWAATPAGRLEVTSILDYTFEV